MTAGSGTANNDGKPSCQAANGEMTCQKQREMSRQQQWGLLLFVVVVFVAAAATVVVLDNRSLIVVAPFSVVSCSFSC